MKDIVYFVLGATVGAISAYLITPQNGKALLADIQIASEEDWQNFQAQWQAGMQKMYASVVGRSLNRSGCFNRLLKSALQLNPYCRSSYEAALDEKVSTY